MKIFYEQLELKMSIHQETIELTLYQEVLLFRDHEESSDRPF